MSLGQLGAQRRRRKRGRRRGRRGKGRRALKSFVMRVFLILVRKGEPATVTLFSSRKWKQKTSFSPLSFFKEKQEKKMLWHWRHVCLVEEDRGHC